MPIHKAPSSSQTLTLSLFPDWRKGQQSEEEVKLLSLFADHPDAPFSIHRFVDHGASACGKHPGEWFGPSATARCIQYAFCHLPLPTSPFPFPLLNQPPTSNPPITLLEPSPNPTKPRPTFAYTSALTTATSTKTHSSAPPATPQQTPSTPL